MITLILVELLLIVFTSLAFLVVLGDPRRAPDPVIVWHLWSFGILTVIAEGSLGLVILHVRVPVWVFVLTYGGQAAVAVWRLALAVQGRRAGRQPKHGGG